MIQGDAGTVETLLNGGRDPIGVAVGGYRYWPTVVHIN